MKIVIANGGSSASYIIRMFRESNNRLIVINSDREEAEKIMTNEHISVYVGSPWRRFVLEEAGVKDADIFISLCEKDTDNFASCIMASTLFGVKKCICVVNNPANVDLYKNLGIDSVISSTYLLAESIRSESAVESLIKTLSIDDNKMVILEVAVLSRYNICNQRLMDIGFPKYASIAAITRHFEVVIPNGQTVLEPKDQLIIATTPEKREEILEFIQRSEKRA